MILNYTVDKVYSCVKFFVQQYSQQCYYKNGIKCQLQTAVLGRYYVPRPSPEYSCCKKNKTAVSNSDRFNSNVSYA